MQTIQPYVDLILDDRTLGHRSGPNTDDTLALAGGEVVWRDLCVLVREEDFRNAAALAGSQNPVL